jgi:ribosome modulation factor
MSKKPREECCTGKVRPDRVEMPGGTANTIYQEGQRAYFELGEMADNPYPTGDPRIYWFVGWLDQREEVWVLRRVPAVKLQTVPGIT